MSTNTTKPTAEERARWRVNHRQDGHLCVDCAFTWPCPTAKLLDALDAVEGELAEREGESLAATQTAEDFLEMKAALEAKNATLRAERDEASDSHRQELKRWHAKTLTLREERDEWKAKHEALLYQYKACHVERDRDIREIARKLKAMEGEHVESAASRIVFERDVAHADLTQLRRALRGISERHDSEVDTSVGAPGCGCPDCIDIDAALATTTRPAMGEQEGENG